MLAPSPGSVGSLSSPPQPTKMKMTMAEYFIEISLLCPGCELLERGSEVAARARGLSNHPGTRRSNGISLAAESRSPGATRLAAGSQDNLRGTRTADYLARHGS